MANWAVVIGIDQYWSEGAHLRGAVRDALRMREWLVEPTGGNVPAENVQLVVSRAEHSPEVDPEFQPTLATKANIILAINNLIELSSGKGERLYFFFAGHGLTTRVSNRDESALLATDFTTVNTDHSIALRSLWEFFETTQFEDQFLFVDACRNVPLWAEGGEFAVGQWTLPRTRDPGLPPVQQFVLYATSPKLKAVEDRKTPGEEHGAFTTALLAGLRGEKAAKAWSWERQCYEVRWERLADFVKGRIEGEARKVAEATNGAVIQIPQDAGSRGVAGRERDVVITLFPTESFSKERLEVFLDPDDAYPKADVRVVDALGDVVAAQVGGTGTSVVFYLAPKTYAVRAAAPGIGEGRTTRPLELYEPPSEKTTISLRPLERPDPGPGAPAETEAPAPAAPPPAEPAPAEPAPVAATRDLDGGAHGRIPLEAPDPLSIVEVADETGNVLEVSRAKAELELPPGFYRIRHVGPEKTCDLEPIALTPDETEKKRRLAAAEPSAATLELLESMEGKPGPAQTIALEGREPVAWAQTSTLVALALGAALHGDGGPAALDLRALSAFDRAKERNGIAVYVVWEEGKADPGSLEIRVWETGEPAPRKTHELRAVAPRLAELVLPAPARPHWVSIHRESEGRPMVFARSVLHGRLSTLVVQVTKGIRLFQYLPALAADDSTSPETLRRVEYLERMLLGGRLDGARELVDELSSAAASDPFVACLCGYVLLRLGRLEEAAASAERAIETAPQLADGFVLRGECSPAGGAAAKQAYTEALAASGVPLFAEGLTRLLEGARMHGIQHPRATIVRFMFQNHMRGSMWSVFTPPAVVPGRLVVTAAQLGYEA
jgi:hypothetical protein